MKKTSIVSRALLCAATMTAMAVLPSRVMATPYASEVTNSAGTIQFYLNESNAVVVVTYEDGTTNANFNGLTTGTNLLKGAQTFALGSHSSYQIAVSKGGTGTASLTATHAVAAPRGVDVNRIVNSPNFGQVYACISTVANTNSALRRLNADMTLINTNSGGVAWVTGSGSSPYRLAVNDDGYVTVGDFASAHSGVWRIDPTLATNQLMLGPVSDTLGNAANSHGAIFSRPLLIGNLQSGGSAVLYSVDAGDFAFNAAQLNSILIYSNLTLANLPRTTAPDLLGPETGLNIANLNNNYPGITYANGYFYASNRRDAVSTIPNVQVYESTNLTQVWNSLYNSGNSDYFIINGMGLGDGAVSPDGRFFAGIGITDNHITVCALTNGIPDASSIYTIVNSNTTSQARGVCFDAADNIYVSSSGVGGIQQWSLGLTATATTYGNAAGQTNFALALPSTSVTVTAVTNQASQSGPTIGVFTITRNSKVAGDLNSPLTVFYTLSGTATNIANYALSGGTATSVTLAAGQATTNIIITPVVDNVSRPTLTVVLTLLANAGYSLQAPISDTVAIANIGPEYIFISSAPGSSMYKSLTNDHATFVLTRWGDTNASGNTLTVSAYTYTGAAFSGAQFTPAQPVTFNPGDVYVTNVSISPLIDTTNYVGNKTFVVGLGSGTGFAAGTNTASVTIIDNVNLPAKVLYANPLTDPNDASNWAVRSANNNMATNAIDNTIEFGYDLTANNGESGYNGLLPLPPSGATSCLRVTVNKNIGNSAGVNLYPTNVTFSGDYAVRFAMNIAEGNNSATTTEGPLFGINHTALDTNWWSGSALQSGWDATGTNETWTSDGVWYWICADGANASGSYFEKSGLGGTNGNTGWTTLGTGYSTSFVNIFKNPAPYSTYNVTVPMPGLPANSSPYNAAILGNPYTNAWADVEIKTVKNYVTLSINKSVIFTYTNNSVWTNGTLMLGYDDPYSSLGGADGAAYFSNLKVVRLASPLVMTQPTNLIVGAGSNATFSVVASFDSSSTATNGQWTFNGANIVGATNATYTIAAVAYANYGTYAWTVNDGNYTVTSTNATLRPPSFVITTNPVASLSVAAGTAASLSVAASTYSGVTNYQWQFNSANRTNVTSRIYGFTAGPTNYGSFRAIVNDGWNYVTSSVAVVTPPAPSIVSVLPATRAGVLGGSAAFTVTALSYSGVTNYQWLSNSVSLTGATNSTVTLTSLQTGNFGSLYTVRVSDGTTTLTSSPAVALTVAVSQPISSPGLNGSKFSLSFNTEVGPSYVIDTTTNLAPANWVPVSTNAGTGGLISVTNAISSTSQGFYRVRLQ